MNKTPEQIAEEMYPYIHPATGSMDREVIEFHNSIIDQRRNGCIAGYHSRDSEIEKLVEVLREITGKLPLSFLPYYYSNSMNQKEEWNKIISKAKEALKPYIAKTEIE